MGAAAARNPELAGRIARAELELVKRHWAAEREALVGQLDALRAELATLRSERDAAAHEIDVLRGRQAKTDAAHARLAGHLARAKLASERLGELRRPAERHSEPSMPPASHTDFEGTEPARPLATAAAACVWTVVGLMQQGLRSDDGAAWTAVAMNLVAGPAIAQTTPFDPDVATNIECDVHELGAHGPRGPPASPG